MSGLQVRPELAKVLPGLLGPQPVRPLRYRCRRPGQRRQRQDGGRCKQQQSKRTARLEHGVLPSFLRLDLDPEI